MATGKLVIGIEIAHVSLRFTITLTMKLASVFLLFLCHSLIAGTPTDALKAFQQAARDQKFDEAWKNTAQFEGASEQITKYLKSRIDRVLEISAKGWSFEIIEEKINGNCAVIITNESTKAGEIASDIDPVFMIKQGEDWKVMPDLTKWDLSKRISPDQQPASMKFDEQKVTAFKELEKWFADRKKALKSQPEP